jgi:DNA polymerase/3'-5' exonuclease PolX
MNFLIRTGNADFAKKMLTKRKWGGLRPDQYEHKDALVLYDGVVVPTPEEEDVFDLWHMAWIPPELRQWPLVGAKS